MGACGNCAVDEHELNKLRAQLADAERRETALSEDRKQLRADLAVEQGNANHLEAQLFAANRTIAQLREDAARVQGRLEDAERFVRRVAKMGRDVIQPTRLELHAIELEERWGLASGSSTGEARPNCGECSTDGCDHMVEPAAPEPAPAPLIDDEDAERVHEPATVERRHAFECDRAHASNCRLDCTCTFCRKYRADHLYHEFAPGSRDGSCLYMLDCGSQTKPIITCGQPRSAAVHGEGGK